MLDPFFGAGTVGVVCRELGRRFVGIELNPEYVAIAERRVHTGEGYGIEQRGRQLRFLGEVSDDEPEPSGVLLEAP